MGETRKTTKELMKEFADFLDTHRGQYITAQDVALETGINWETSRMLIQSLEHFGVVRHVKEEHNVYRIIQKPRINKLIGTDEDGFERKDFELGRSDEKE